MKINKRDAILQSIIDAYLADNSPIGSTELMVRMDEPIPASTIRVYFKKLSDEGAIKQLHISSGRIPTISTMISYWLKKLNFDEKLVLSDHDELERIVSNFEIYCMIYNSDDEILKEVINYNSRYILLIFDETEFMVKFNERVYKLLLNLVGSSLGELEEISMQVGLGELRRKIENFKLSKVGFLANEVVAFKIFEDERFKLLLDPSFSNRLPKNIVFEPFFKEGFMGIRQDVVFDGRDATMFCAGSVYENYESFFSQIARLK
ncbi:HrcA family transcriptional regulator [uncultured Campylobacter sp.]|uniref:HrcA family transcriptional regulator n=1 Tax=uncultured Campylobacter sp. TaxID=218934 RepID=UPI00260B9820|nr:HrcA family transcriptional regulator [uncultured Campylobacter sp.]